MFYYKGEILVRPANHCICFEFHFPQHHNFFCFKVQISCWWPHIKHMGPKTTFLFKVAARLTYTQAACIHCTFHLVDLTLIECILEHPDVQLAVCTFCSSFSLLFFLLFRFFSFLVLILMASLWYTGRLKIKSFRSGNTGCITGCFSRSFFFFKFMSPKQKEIQVKN